MNAVALLPLSHESLASPEWRATTPPELIRAFNRRDAAKFARFIRKSAPFDAANRRGDLRPFQHALWSQHAFPATERSRAVASLLSTGEKTKSNRKSRLRREADISSLLDRYSAGTEPDGFEILAWLTLLLNDASLTDELFLRLWTMLHSWLHAVCRTPPQLAGRLLDDQRALLLGELPWSFGLTFPLVKGARRVREQAGRSLQSELTRLCDEDGIPHAALLSRLPLCVAPFARASALGGLTGRDWREGESRRRFRRYVERAVALLQTDDRTALSNGVVHAPASLLHFAAEAAGLKKSHGAALLAASLATTSPKHRRTAIAPRTKRKHRPGVQSDTARLACLRNNWGVGADACTIAFDGPTPRIDLTAFGVPILSGDWSSATASARSQRSEGDWECVCWFSESTADYVELQRTTKAGVRVLRQALLSRDDHFLLLCDIVDAGESADQVEHTFTLPLLPDSTAVQDALTREWRLQRSPLDMRVIPLGLAQESIHRADGSLSIDAAQVTLSQRATGPRLACPLLLDWSPTRRRSPAQWKQLTVAENARMIPPAEALAARWRIGDEQWLYYHSLTRGDTARTFLGHHSFHETVIAEVNSTGDVAQLVEVEYESDES